MKKSVLFITLSFLITSCSLSTPPYEGRFTLPITMAATKKEKEAILSIVNKYNNNHLDKIDVEIDVKDYFYKDKNTQVLEDLLSYSLISTNLISLTDVIYNNLSSEIDPIYIDSIRENYLYAVKEHSINNNINGFPYSTQPFVVLYYDPSIYDQNDIKSLETMLRKAEENNKYIVFPVNNSLINSSLFMGDNALGPDSVSYNKDEEGNVVYNTNWDNEKGVEMCSYLSKMLSSYYKKSIIDPSTYTVFNSDDNISAYIGLSITYDEVINYHPSFKVAVLPSFQINNVSYQMSSIAVSRGFVVNNSKTKEEQSSAMALGSLLTTSESQLELFKVTNLTPSNTNATKSKDFMDNASELQIVLAEQSLNSFSETMHFEDKFYTVLESIGNHILLNDISDWSSFLKNQMDALRSK